MKTLKSIETKHFSICLVEYGNQYSVIKVVLNQRLNSLPTSDLNMALSIFELWHSELVNEVN